MRITLAPTSALTDARGHNEKARPETLAGQGRAVVSTELKADRRECANTRASLTPTHPGLADAAKLARSLSRRSPVKASNGADNEHSAFR